MSAVKSLSPKQFKALKLAAKTGIRLKGELGTEIKDRFSRFIYLNKIINELDILQKYGVGLNVARKAVDFAIYGFNPPNNTPFNVSPYEGLFDKEEAKRIMKEREIRHGQMTRDKSLGFNGQGSYERKENSKRALEIMTDEQKALGSKNSVLARGLIPWSQEETKGLLEHVNDKNFQNNGRPNNVKIATYLNDKFHEGRNVRDRISVYLAKVRYDKSRKD